MNRLLLAPLVLLAAGCASAPAAQDEYGMPLDPMDATPRVYDDGTSPIGTVGEAILSVPETAFMLPYKILASGLRGGYDGVADGIEEAPMPILGVLLSPVTAAGGIVGGAVQGAVREPHYVGSTGEFGRGLGRPWTTPVHVWK